MDLKINFKWDFGEFCSSSSKVVTLKFNLPNNFDVWEILVLIPQDSRHNFLWSLLIYEGFSKEVGAGAWNPAEGYSDC